MSEMSKVRIEKVGDRIHLKTDYTSDRELFDRNLRKIKAVPGASWAKSHKAWTFPLTFQTCLDLRAKFGKRLVVGNALAEWAREEKARAEAVKPLLSAVDAELQHLPQRAPTLYAAMSNRPYQLPAVKFAAELGTALVADQPGLGKTLVGMAACIERWATGTHLILAPKTSVGVVWEPELKRWLSDVDGGVAVFPLRGTRQQRTAALAEFAALHDSADRPAHIFVIANTEMVRTKEHEDCADENCEGVGSYDHDMGQHKTVKWYEHEYPELFDDWDSIIVDESHKALIKTAGKESQTRRGMTMLAKLDADGDQLRLPLTGTPFKGKTKNLWGTLNWMRPKQFSSFWTWANSYLTVEDNGYGHDIGDVREDRKEAFYAMLDGVMIRRTKSELRRINPAWAPPDKVYETVWCEMEPKQAKAYKAMLLDAVAAVDGGKVTANGVLAEMTRLKQFAHAYGEMVDTGKLDEDGVPIIRFSPSLPSGKFTRILQDLEERGISGDPDQVGGELKVVIGSQFTAMLKLYSAELTRLGIEHFMLTGETSDRKRVEQQQRFQQPGGPRLFLINTTAGGVSITLDAADELWILDETWVPDEQEQLEDRVHRASNVEHQVTIRYFVTLGTIEEDIAAVTMGKDETQKEHLDGRRGVELAARILHANKEKVA